MSDYIEFLNEFGLTEEYVSNISKTDDLIEISGFEIEVKDSPIHGLGIFATSDFKNGDFIAPARIGINRTICGRYTNHDKNNNVVFVSELDGLNMYASSDIKNGDEILIDYRQALFENARLSTYPINFGDIIKSLDIDISQYSNREKIEIIEWWLLKNYENLADDLPVRNFIHGGIYAREITIPAGICLTGKIHSEEHMCVLSSGDLSVMTDEGIKRIQAPFIFMASTGMKKIGYAHSDCTFTTFHRADTDNLEDLESRLFFTNDITWVANLIDSQHRVAA